jgi:hypothetical protein
VTAVRNAREADLREDVGELFRHLHHDIVLEAGRSEGILHPVLYSVVLTMALATTVMTGPLLHCLERPAGRRADTVHRHGLATERATGEASR